MWQSGIIHRNIHNIININHRNKLHFSLGEHETSFKKYYLPQNFIAHFSSRSIIISTVWMCIAELTLLYNGQNLFKCTTNAVQMQQNSPTQQKLKALESDNLINIILIPLNCFFILKACRLLIVLHKITKTYLSSTILSVLTGTANRSGSIQVHASYSEDVLG